MESESNFNSRLRLLTSSTDALSETKKTVSSTALKFKREVSSSYAIMTCPAMC